MAAGDREPPPWWAYALPLLSLLAVSSAAPVLRLMDAVPPFARASWRQQLTTAALLPLLAHELRTLEPEARARLRTPSALLRLALSGISLGAHFGLWIWSIDATTLTHSVLLVCSNPIWIALGRCALRLPIDAGELVGVALGFGGLALAMVGGVAVDDAPIPTRAGRVEQVRLLGDLAALGGALAFCCYIVIGRSVRQWLPTTVYVVPVFGLSAASLAVASALFEAPAPLSPRAPPLLLGWASAQWALPSLYLALGPGICGHTVINLCVRYIDPLVLSLVFLGAARARTRRGGALPPAGRLTPAPRLPAPRRAPPAGEPLTSSLIGWLMGVSGVPGAWTAVGGPVVLAGCALTLAASRRRERRVEARRGQRDGPIGAVQLAEAAESDLASGLASAGGRGPDRARGASDDDSARSTAELIPHARAAGKHVPRAGEPHGADGNSGASAAASPAEAPVRTEHHHPGAEAVTSLTLRHEANYAL